MKKLSLFSILATALLTTPTLAQNVRLSMTLGSKLNEACSAVSISEASFCTAYIMATGDSLSTQGEICLPVNVTGGQLVAIVKKHLQANPEQWHYHAQRLIKAALKAALPCAAGRVR